jgi:hypothetical protein
MRKRLAIGMSLLVLFTMVVGTVSASGSLPGGSWYTRVTVQNASMSTQATVQMTVYEGTSGGTTLNGSDVNLLEGEGATLDSSFVTSGLIGSAVLSSNNPVVAIEEISNFPRSGLGTAGGKARGMNQGISAPSTTLYFPVAKLNWFTQDTIFYVQNAGTSDATATAVFQMGNAAFATSKTYTFTTAPIQPGRMVVISPADALDSGGQPIPSAGAGTNNNNLRANLGGMRITSSQPLAGSYAEYFRNNATSVNITRALSSADNGTTAFVPNVKRWWYNRWTGMAIQNTSGVPITVTASIKGVQQYNGGTCANQPFTDVVPNILPGQVSFLLFYPGYTTLTDNCLATATLSSGGVGSFVAIANENNTPGQPAAGSVYYTMSQSTVSTRLLAPMFVDQVLGMDGAIVLQNVTANPATNVVATFKCMSLSNSAKWTATSKPLTIQPGGSYLFWRPFSYQPNKNDMQTQFQSSNAQCAVTVTSDQNLVGIYNEVSTSLGVADDTNYELINTAP